MEIFFKAILLLVAGVALLRIGGRKTISQMTVAQVVIMISIGTIIVQPIAGDEIPNTIFVAAILVGGMMLLEYLQVKSNLFETIITGKAVPVIEDGVLMVQNLKKLRMTVDQLEMRLRQSGVRNISDVKTATLEANGQLGFELKRYAQPVTIGDLESKLAPLLNQTTSEQTSSIFSEVRKGSPEQHHDQKLH